MLKDLELYLDTVDQSDSRDYIYEDYMKEYAEGKGKQIWNKLVNKVYDQFDQKETYKACTCYGLTVLYNGYNIVEYKNMGARYEQEDPKWKRQAYQATRGFPNKGSSLQAMMKFFIKRKLIEGYMRIDTIVGAKQAIDNGFLIYTGTKSCDWRKAGRKGKFVYKKNGGGHCFSIVGYDDSGFIAVNSFGTDRGNRGYFVIPYEDFKYLFSKYAIIDKDDTGILANLEYEREFKKAIEAGITNGSNPDKPATRKEVAVMVYRSLAIKN